MVMPGLGFPSGSVKKKKKKKICLQMQETQVPSLCREDPLEKEMATHSSILAWIILWTEKPGGLQSMGSQSQIWLSMHVCVRAHTHTC